MTLQGIPKADLKRCVAELAAAIESGRCQPEPLELAALSVVCQERGLWSEAMRLKRWLSQERTP